MTSSQYYNIICGTLSNMTEEEKGDSACVAKKIFDNCGEAFPSGNCAAVWHVLKSNDYVNWRSCTAEEAQQYANQGIPTVAINEKRITIIQPEECVLFVKNPFTGVIAGSGQLNTVNKQHENEENRPEYFAASYVGRKKIVVYAKVEQSPGTLNESQIYCNADYIFDCLSNRGFTKGAICGILGNMQRECGLNPGLWEKLNNIKVGYGLLQWTKAENKYLKWAAETKILKGTSGEWAEEINTLGTRNPQRLIDTQLDFFLYSCKLSSGDYREWYVPKGSGWDSFEKYVESNEPARTLAMWFHDCYERSGDSDSELKERQDYAEKWDNEFR